MRFFLVLVDRLGEFDGDGNSVAKRSSYLEQPVAPTVEGGDDGGVYVAAIQTLGRRGREKRTERKDINFLTIQRALDWAQQL